MASLTELATDISRKTDHLVGLMSKSGIDLPSWDENAPAEFAEYGVYAGEIQQTRYALIDQLTKALRLAMGPTEYVKSLISNAVWHFLSLVQCRLVPTACVLTNH